MILLEGAEAGDNVRANIIFLHGVRALGRVSPWLGRGFNGGKRLHSRRMNNNRGTITNSVLNLGQPIGP